MAVMSKALFESDSVDVSPYTGLIDGLYANALDLSVELNRSFLIETYRRAKLLDAHGVPPMRTIWSHVSDALARLIERNEKKSPTELARLRYCASFLASVSPESDSSFCRHAVRSASHIHLFRCLSFFCEELGDDRRHSLV